MIVGECDRGISMSLKKHENVFLFFLIFSTFCVILRNPFDS